MITKWRILFSFVFMAICYPSSGQLLIEKKLLKAMSPGGLRNPEIEFPRFNFIANDQLRYTNDSLINKVTFINFWFGACTPCIAEMTSLNSLYDKYKQNPSFLFLSFSTDTPEEIQKLSSKYSIPYPVISISISEIYKYNFRLGFPTILIIDRVGKIRYIKCGGESDPILARKSIETLYYPEIEDVLNEN